MGGVRTETGCQLLAAAPGGGQGCIELEGRDVIRPCRKIFQEDTGRAEGDIALGLLAETLPQALAAAVVGEGEKLRLDEADERSLQHAGKAEIVVRKQEHDDEPEQVPPGERSETRP